MCRAYIRLFACSFNIDDFCFPAHWYRDNSFPPWQADCMLNSTLYQFVYGSDFEVIEEAHLELVNKGQALSKYLRLQCGSQSEYNWAHIYMSVATSRDKLVTGSCHVLGKADAPSALATPLTHATFSPCRQRLAPASCSPLAWLAGSACNSPATAGHATIATSVSSTSRRDTRGNIVTLVWFDVAGNAGAGDVAQQHHNRQQPPLDASWRGVASFLSWRCCRWRCLGV